MEIKMLFGSLFGNQNQNQIPNYNPKFSNKPNHVTVFTGAGTSVIAGCPLMRGFIDKAKDLLQDGLIVKKEDQKCINRILELYIKLTRSFSITEEDIENIETILSFVDLSKLFNKVPIKELNDEELSNSIRHFIDIIVSKSIYLPSPINSIWYDPYGRNELAFKKLIQAISYHGKKATIITTNYDCILEYFCHCLGIPFTYNRELGDGIEILKLHGSNNWVECKNETCKSKAYISNIKYYELTNSNGYGYIEREDHVCQKCGNKLTPIIIPPAMSKQLENDMIKKAWSRALDVLSISEVFVSIGYSLPLNDTHIKQLFHLGFSSGKLRQSLIVTGQDEMAINRWNSIFREFWRNARLSILPNTFQQAIDLAIRKALIVPNNYSKTESVLSSLLPMKWGDFPEITNKKNLDEAIKFHSPDLIDKGINWSEVAMHCRDNKPLKNEGRELHRKIFLAGKLNWYPEKKILPCHGNKL